MYVPPDAMGPGGGPPEWPQRPDDPAGLSGAQRDLLWSLRRLAMVRPLGSARDAHRDPYVHALLQRRFGDQGLGLEHHLRCLIVGLARRAIRPIQLHRPCHAQLSADERRLLMALDDVARPARGAALLAPLAGTRGAELLPLLAGIAALLPR